MGTPIREISRSTRGYARRPELRGLIPVEPDEFLLPEHLDVPRTSIKCRPSAAAWAPAR